MAQTTPPDLTQAATPTAPGSGTATDQPVLFQVTKRDGRVVEFEPTRIQRAVEAAFRAEYCDKSNTPLTDDQFGAIQRIAASVIEAASSQDQSGAVLEVEGVQDLVEENLMRGGEFSVAKRFIVYREERSRARRLRMESQQNTSSLQVTTASGSAEPVNTHLVKRRIYEACHGLPQCKPNELLQDLYANMYNGISTAELEKAMVMIARQRIEREPAYNKVATRLVLNITDREAGEVAQGKQRSIEKGAPFGYRLDAHEIGRDHKGRPNTAVVATIVEAKQQTETKPVKTDPIELALETALRTARPAMGFTTAELLAFLPQRIFKESLKDDSRRRAVQRALQQLETQGSVLSAKDGTINRWLFAEPDRNRPV